jgi:hypothetical protein
VHHISKQNTKTNKFPRLQERIILYLAQSRPQTINEIVKGIKGQYKSSWLAFNALKKKGLIETISSKDYHGRQYPCFWLSELGTFLAISEGAKSEALLKATLEIYPNNKNLHFLVEAVPVLGEYAREVLYLVAMTRGAIEQTDLTSIFAAQTINKLAPQQIKEFVAILKRYPEQRQQIRKSLRELSDLI